MGIIELLFLAVGLSMDAFAVSVCKGLALPKINIKSATVCGAWFGIFQALMPLLGYLLGIRFASYIDAVAPWIAFILLVLIGGNMIRESRSKDSDSSDSRLDFKSMLPLAIATSIDALAVGITFVCVPVRISAAVGSLGNTLIGVAIIGVVTFILSCAGVKIGNLFGVKYKSRAEFMGGLILCLLGLKILLEHNGMFS